MQLPIKTRASAVSYSGIFTAVLIVLSFFESRFGISFGVPGVKAGLSNIIIILALLIYGWKTGLYLSIAKIIFSLIFSSGISGFIFTAFGTLSSFIMMFATKVIFKDKVSAVGISVMGGAAHITAQYLCSAVILNSNAVWGIYPSALGLSVLTSAVVGFICNLILERKYKNET